MIPVMHALFLSSFGPCKRQTLPRRLLPLARALAARGHEVGLLIPAWDCPQSEARGQRSEVGGQVGEVRVIVPELGLGGGGVYPQLLGRLQRQIRAFEPDILFVSKGLGYAGRAGRWWMKQGGQIVVDVDDLEPAWHREAGRNRLAAWLLTRQEAALIRDATGVIFASHFLLAYYRHIRTQHPKRPLASLPYYLPNGLIPAASRAPVEANPPRALLLTRGHDVDAGALVQVWTQTVARVPQAELLIAGGWTPPQPLPQTRVLGWLPPDRYTQTIRSAAVCLFTPTKKPLVQAKSPARVLDCLAQGVPVLTLDVGEYAALVREGGGEPAPDEAELIARLQQLLTAPQARGRAGQEAFAGITPLHWDRRAASLETWLLQLKPEPSQAPLHPRLR